MPTKKLLNRCVKALRKADESQHARNGYLCSSQGRCALGVIADVVLDLAPEPCGRSWYDPEIEIFSLGGEFDLLSKGAQVALGVSDGYASFRSGKIEIDGRAYESVADASDNGATYDQIADILENQPEEVFWRLPEGSGDIPDRLSADDFPEFNDDEDDLPWRYDEPEGTDEPDEPVKAQAKPKAKRNAKGRFIKTA